MSARSVQISLDPELLAEVDRLKETRESGRSAVIRRALRLYLEVRKRHEADAAYVRGYGGKRDEVYDDLAALMGGQAWPGP
jgi:metal-responsive CopG/Arc/MetJ family transcriptional regulator